MSTATIDTRATVGAEVLAVDFADRIVTVVVAPYEQPALVEYDGQIWEEVFSRGSFDGLNGTDPQRIRVNREHSRADAIGACIGFDTGDRRGLVADLKIANTARGDETLQLCSERMLSASAGFGVNPRTGQTLDRARRIRRVTRAYLDHVALVQAPAYDGARVLAVRSATPDLDRYLADPIVAWAEFRIDPVYRWARRRLGR